MVRHSSKTCLQNKESKRYYLSMEAQKLLPFEHLHSDSQMHQKEQAKMKVTDPSVPHARPYPQAVDRKKILSRSTTTKVDKKYFG